MMSGRLPAFSEVGYTIRESAIMGFDDYKRTCYTATLVKHHQYPELRSENALRNVYLTTQNCREWWE